MCASSNVQSNPLPSTFPAESKSSCQSPIFDLLSTTPSNDLHLKKATLSALICVLAVVWAPLPATQVKPERTRRDREPPVVRLSPPPLPPEEVVAAEIIAREPRPMPFLQDTPKPVVAPDVHFDSHDLDVRDAAEWPLDHPIEPLDEGPLNMDHKGLIPPKFTFKQSPNYPPSGQRARLQGTVWIEAVLGANGTIRDIRVLRGLYGGKFGFEQAAVDALSGWRFVPGRLGNRPVSVLMTLRIEFKLR